jgi:hypothetical protein
LIAGNPVSASAEATSTLDQFNEQRDQTGGWCVDPDGGAVAQTFTAGITGAMDLVEVGVGLHVSDPYTTNITVKIVDMTGGDPFAGAALATETVSTTINQEHISNPQWVSVTLNPAAAVVAGTQYAILLSATPLSDTCVLAWTLGSWESTYSGGSSSNFHEGHFFDWHPGDTLFRTYVSTGTDNDGDGSLSTVDCDDDDPDRYPGLAEIANDGIDQNCNFYDKVTYYTDADNDTFGVTSSAADVDGEQPANAAVQGGDADDSDDTVYPDAPELCDGLDNDQNNTVDDGWPDADSDGLADCVDDDDDGDNIVDEQDPDGVATVVADSTTAISGGNRKAFLGRLDYIESLIANGETDDAVVELQALRKRTDGCGTKAEKNDWIIDCDDQQAVRALIDSLITNLNA